jgi:uncharacterized protein (DUF433 family)
MKQSETVIHSDPEIMGGTPVFVGTRVPLATLLDYLEGGQPLSEFLEDFPTVTREQAVAALEQAKEALLARARPAWTTSALGGTRRSCSRDRLTPMAGPLKMRSNLQPMSSSREDVSALLAAWSAGDSGARDLLIPLVYEQLRRHTCAARAPAALFSRPRSFTRSIYGSWISAARRGRIGTSSSPSGHR